MKSKLNRLPVFALALLLPVAGAPAESLPAPFEADYEGAKFPLTAKAKITLSRVGDYYRYTLRGSIFAAFYKWTEVYDCSVLHVRGSELYPLEYVHRDTRKRRRNVHTRFDWANGTVRTTAADGSVQEIKGLKRVAWDVMSIQVRMRADMPDASPGDAFDYALVRRGRVTQHRARVQGVEALETGKQSLRTVKVSTEGAKRETTLWFAKDYAWLPVRISMDGVMLNLASPPGNAARNAAPPTGDMPRC